MFIYINTYINYLIFALLGPNLILFVNYILIEMIQASLVAHLVKNPVQCRRPGLHPWFGKIPWRRERLPTPVFWPGEFHGQSMELQRVGHN